MNNAVNSRQSSVGNQQLKAERIKIVVFGFIRAFVAKITTSNQFKIKI
jgi:hypothetical protein